MIFPDGLQAILYLRLVARVPVLLMSDTGCGKTSLVCALAAAMGLPRGTRFLVRRISYLCAHRLTHEHQPRLSQVLNLHAGVEEADIEKFVERCEAAAARWRRLATFRCSRCSTK